jgi:NADPH:quinone reductase
LKALVCESSSGPGALRWRDMAVPTPAANELLVAVHAAALNFADTLLTHGNYQIRLPAPFVPGMEIAGEVLGCGQDVSGFRTGDRIAAVLPRFGGFAEQACVDAAHAFPVGTSLPYSIAACIPSVYGTAFYALTTLARLQAGETVLVLGAAGGVGCASVKLARTLGATVIAAVGDPDKAALAHACGADHVVSYASAGLRTQLRELPGAERGIDVVIDPVGGDLSAEALRSLAWGGRYLVVGFASGSIPALAANIVLLKGAAVLGVNFGAYALQEPAATRRIYERLVELLSANPALWPPISASMPMSDGATAMLAMEQRRLQGKVVLLPRL